MPETSDRATGSQPDHDRLEQTEKRNKVDEAGDESFPASDPPAYSGGSATPSDEDHGKRYPSHLDRDEEGKEVDRG